MIKIECGLDLPISGVPEQRIKAAHPVRSVALIGFDYHGMKPTMAVQVGDRVKLGQVLFTDKKSPSVSYTAPDVGVVSAIHRGEKRVLQSVVIDLDGDEQLEFARYPADQLATLSAEQIRDNLLQSGLWTALRTQPFGKVLDPESSPSSIFVTAVDTQPLAADPQAVIAEQGEAFRAGLTVLGRLARVFLCRMEGISLPDKTLFGVTVQTFAGPHPADLPGTHIHFLDPVGADKSVWNLNCQDVIAIGKLFTTGQLWTEWVIALAGPVVEKPRLVRTRLGANLNGLAAGQLQPGSNRLISGSMLGGRTAHGAYAYLGRYHLQLSCLKEGNRHEFPHYLHAEVEKHSLLNVSVSRLLGGKHFVFTTSTNSSPRTTVSVGDYKAMMPLDILPTQLLRYLIVGDTGMAQKLNTLKLDREDPALCSYACAGKYGYGPTLRDSLARIEQGDRTMGLRNLLDKVERHFEKDGRYEK